MFAFAILDLRQRALYVVRDRLGLKPVVYAHRDDGFAFASTTRALLPWLPREARAFSVEGHRRVPRAPDDSGAADDLLVDRAAAAGALAALRPRDGPRRNARVLAAGAFDRAVARNARRGNPDAHGRRPAARRSSCRRASTRPRSPAALRRWVSTGCRASPPRSRARRSTSRRWRAPTPIVWASPISRSTCPKASPPISSASSPISTSPSPTRRGADVVPRARNDAARQGRARRRRRRRALRRLQALREAPAHALAPRARGAGTGARPPASAAAAGSARSRSCGSTGARPMRCASRASRRASAPSSRRRPHRTRTTGACPPPAAIDLPALLEIDRLNYLPDYILRKADLCTMAHGLEMRAPFLDHRFVGAVIALPQRHPLHDAAAQAARAGDVRARRSRSVRPQEARVQPAARRMARARSRAASAGHRRAAREISRRDCCGARDRRVRRPPGATEGRASPSRCCNSCCSMLRWPSSRRSPRQPNEAGRLSLPRCRV